MWQGCSAGGMHVSFARWGRSNMDWGPTACQARIVAPGPQPPQCGPYFTDEVPEARRPSLTFPRNSWPDWVKPRSLRHPLQMNFSEASRGHSSLTFRSQLRQELSPSKESLSVTTFPFIALTLPDRTAWTYSLSASLSQLHKAGTLPDSFTAVSVMLQTEPGT